MFISQLTGSELRLREICIRTALGVGSTLRGAVDPKQHPQRHPEDVIPFRLLPWSSPAPWPGDGQEWVPAGDPFDLPPGSFLVKVPVGRALLSLPGVAPAPLSLSFGTGLRTALEAVRAGEGLSLPAWAPPPDPSAASVSYTPLLSSCAS